MKIEDFHLLKIITCWLAIFVLPITSICQFPPQWSGNWFQSGLQHDVQINTTSIQSKGVCIETIEDRYLLEDKEDNCRRCVVIHEKHYNVLQYKETYCFPRDSKDSLDVLCEKITGDAPLYSMFRLDAKAITCPFKGGPPFTFTYNRGSGDCKTPVSKSDSCTDDSRMLLRYQACPDVHNSESTVEELTCLASWRDGSMKYMVGKLEHKMTSTDEDRYRCFVYNQGDNNVYDVAQSGDATCNGLQSATEGSRTMKLTKGDLSHHERASCKFPPWLTEHHTWHLLDHSKTYHFSSHNGTIRVTSVRDGVNVLEMRAVCNSILASSDGQIIISAHITVGCESGYRCMAFYRRDGHVIEIQQSTREVQNSEDACASQNFNSQTLPYITLITPYLRRRRCPFLGRYTVSNNDLWRLAASTKQMRENMPEEKVNCEKGKQMLSLGCTKPETMEFQSECNSDVTAGYSCHGDWIDSNGTSYLIAIPLSEVSAPTDKYCFVIYNLPETSTFDGSRRGRRLQLYSLTKSCRRDLHQDSSDQQLMFNITHHADCDGLVNGGSSPLSRNHISFLMSILVPMLVITLATAALNKPEHISR
ncbi:uncharacterized protein LOC135847000 [Planococcus citri]|uniref:uncharacterized protein LOC135847000 n=1 Tax=Planococcus citri TaxID=170843 RepID=UPI0031F928E9